MSTAPKDRWITGWTVDEPLQIGYVAVAPDEGEWVPAKRPGFEIRDLGLAAVSEQKISAMHVRRTGDGEVDLGWSAHDLDFQFVYVLQGSVLVEDERGEEHRLGAGDTLYHPGLLRHRKSGYSEDYEAVEVFGPAQFTTIEGRDAELPSRAQELDPERRGVYTFDAPEAYIKGDGPRSFWGYRDLGLREPTEGRIHMHVVRAGGEAGDGTGWHYHTMAQWFLILGGWSRIQVEDHEPRRIEYLDSMCIGSGEDMRHNVAPFSGDYVVLEMCVPAVYETIAVDRPETARPSA